MMKNLRYIVFVIWHVLIFFMALASSSKDDERKPYIVYMGELRENSGNSLSCMDEHHSILSDVLKDEKLAKESKIHSYGKSFNGFAAHLLPHEAEKLKEKENVISVFPNEMLKPLTTRSWDFVGMPLTVKRNLHVESDLIVGIIDSGIYMDSPSFDDKGYGPPPKKWKGRCDKGVNFTGCNNKVIGAQIFEMLNVSQIEENSKSPVDVGGHGTHCAGIIGGNAVPGTNFLGFAEGTARGGVPSVRLAMYTVCFSAGCGAMNALAAFDKAIYDGVDIISISQGYATPHDNYFQDVFAIGSFHAQKRGILTVSAAGNDGPALATVLNVSPWILTVGASGFDRDLQTLLKLGNGKVYYGRSFNSFEPKKEMYPLTNGLLAKKTNMTNQMGSECWTNSLDEEKVRGSIVNCNMRFDGAEISRLHGAGVISSTDYDNESPRVQVLPGVQLNKSDGESIDQYINSTRSPTAVIYKSVPINRTTPSPYVAYFSSRGPQTTSRNILKPDIVAPGVSILSTWASNEKSRKYYIESGTSFACPHAAAAAAYVKSFHPEWSVAAIKSALMTTAKPMKVKPEGGVLASGSGMINPTEALDPGLVYDIDFDSYISFLCKEGYNSTTIPILTGSNNYQCSKVKPAKGTDGLNYPSMHLQVPKQNSSSFSAVYYRTVTNVGEGVSLYKANIESPKELTISVVPKVLSFTKPNQMLSFRVDVNGKFESETSWFLEASLVWSDSSNHNVKSPILVYRNVTSSPR